MEFSYMLLEPLSLLEAVRWLLIPAVIQWLILQKAQGRSRDARMALLAPVCWMLLSILGSFLVVALGFFLLSLLFSALFQSDPLSMLRGTLRLVGPLLLHKNVLYALGRVGLAAAGWGLGWVIYARETGQPVLGHPARGRTRRGF